MPLSIAVRCGSRLLLIVASGLLMAGFASVAQAAAFLTVEYGVPGDLGSPAFTIRYTAVNLTTVDLSMPSTVLTLGGATSTAYGVVGVPGPNWDYFSQFRAAITTLHHYTDRFINLSVVPISNYIYIPINTLIRTHCTIGLVGSNGFCNQAFATTGSVKGLTWGQVAVAGIAPCPDNPTVPCGALPQNHQTTIGRFKAFGACFLGCDPATGPSQYFPILSSSSVSFIGQEVSRSFVPEPSTAPLAGLGLLALSGYAARRRVRRRSKRA